MKNVTVSKTTIYTYVAHLRHHLLDNVADRVATLFVLHILCLRTGKGVVLNYCPGGSFSGGWMGKGVLEILYFVCVLSYL